MKLKHILCSIISFSENRAVCKIMWKNMVKPDRTQMTIIWRMRFAFWTAQASDIHSEYVILITFSTATMVILFASLLRYTCIAWLVYIVWYNQRNIRQILIAHHTLLFINSPSKDNNRAKAPGYAVHRLSYMVPFHIYILRTVVNVVTRLWIGRSRNRGSNPISGKRFAFSKASKPILGNTFCCLRGTREIFHGVKTAGVWNLPLNDI